MKKLQEIREFLSFLYIKMALCMFIYKFVALKGLNILHKIYSVL